MGKSIISKVGAVLGDSVREAGKKTLAAAPYLVNPEFEAGQVVARIGEKAFQEVESLASKAKVLDGAGKTKFIKTNPNKPVTVSRTTDATKVVTTSPKKVELTTPDRTKNQLAGDKQAQETKNYNNAQGAKTTAIKAASPEVGKLASQASAALSTAPKIAGAAKDIGNAIAKPNNQPTQNSNPVRMAGNSAPKIHPDNNPLKR